MPGVVGCPAVVNDFEEDDRCAYRNAPRTMPRGIVVPYRIVVDIRIPIPRLRALALFGDQAVGLGEPPQGRVVPPRVVKVQADGTLFSLAERYLLALLRFLQRLAAKHYSRITRLIACRLPFSKSNRYIIPGHSLFRNSFPPHFPVGKANQYVLSGPALA